MTIEEAPIVADPFTVLAERDLIAGRAMDKFYEKVNNLKEHYGSWCALPNQDRTRLANELRASGWLYEPGTGWFRLHNSITLSSL